MGQGYKMFLSLYIQTRIYYKMGIVKKTFQSTIYKISGQGLEKQHIYWPYYRLSFLLGTT